MRLVTRGDMDGLTSAVIMARCQGLGDGIKLVHPHEITERTVAIDSNEPFSGWTKTFTDPRLCAAIVDRLTFGDNIIETGTDSYRLAQSKNQQAAPH